MIPRRIAVFLFLLSGYFAAPAAYSQDRGPVSAGGFTLCFDEAGLASLKRTNDAYDTDYIAKGRTLGPFRVRYRMLDQPWREFSAVDPGNRRSARRSDENGGPQLTVVYNESDWNDYYADLEVVERFRVEGEALYWTIHVRNCTHKPLELGDVVLPLPFNTEERWDKTIMYTQRVVPHTFVSGHGSFLFWMRPNSQGPYLVMTPVSVCPLFEPAKTERNFTPTHLEYADRQGVYIHSKVMVDEAVARGGNWRQPQTSLLLTPKFTPGDEVTWALKFRWAPDYDGVRDVLVEEGLFDVQAAPGMTVPVDLEVRLALRTRNAPYTIEAEHPGQTKIIDLGEKERGTRIYSVRFARLGENFLRLRWGKGQSMILEFFATEPLETLIKKRAAFLVRNQQHRDPSKWYNGLFSEWDMKTGILRGPDDTDGLLDYVVACDDPGLCKAPYVAAKNVAFPEAAEIAAVEDYVRHFVWGGLQRTDKETYPFAVYGIDNWKINRESGPADRNGWTGHLWRLYDYPHIINLYLSLQGIAGRYPKLVAYCDARGYLERAFGTAKAYFTVPQALGGWPTESLGTMDEVVINDLIDELRAAGMKDEEAWLRGAWEKKIEYWVNGDRDFFYSEYPFDPTGFEAYGGFVHYGLEELAKPERTLRVTREGLDKFAAKTIAANIATRGSLEPAYHALGVEGNLRYMSQMGGWAVLDFGLNHAADPWPYLRLGYASFLSSWCLMNTGTADTNYGYWWPGKKNDGAAGSGFIFEAFGRTWLGKPQKRGAWQYSAEIDLGFGAALRTSATILADDPLFGRIVYGGVLTEKNGRAEVIPRDGLRQRFHVVAPGRRLHIAFDRDGFAADRPISYDPASGEIAFSLENRTGDAHVSRLSVSGFPPGAFEVAVNGKAAGRFEGGDPERPVGFPVPKGRTAAVIIRRMR